MKYLLIGLLVALAGCEASTPAEKQASNRNDAQDLISRSTVECVDHNRVRIIAYGFHANTGVAAGWTILDRDGKPIRCGDDTSTEIPS